VKVITSLDEVLLLQGLAKSVHVSPDIVEYTTTLVSSLRADPDVSWGPSVRASIALYKCARVLALLDGRNFVIPDDIKALAFNAMEHRIRVKPEAEMDDITPHVIIERALNKIPVPKLTI
jgi:MoxR-like ATPase